MMRILGIIGGMGPEATVDFMDKIIKATPAGDDCDHIHMIVDNNPQVPSRVKAILGAGESPAPVLVEMARQMERYGADFLAMPCNSAHYYYEDIKKAVKIPVLNIIECTRIRILNAIPGIKAIGLLASTAVLVTQLYHRAFEADNIKLLTPPENLQQNLMKVIFAVKANKIDAELLKETRRIANELIERGAQGLILGCTELSVLARDIRDFSVPAFDPAQILAEEVVRIVKSQDVPG